MNNLLEFIDYMNEHKKIIEKIIKIDENDFLCDEIALNVGLGFIEGIKDRLINLDKLLLIKDKILYEHYNDFLSIHNYFVNDYGEINGHFVYDYLINDYLILFNRITNLLKS